MADVNQIREALAKARHQALAWTPIAGPEPTWQMTAAAIIGLYENAFHEAGCEGCAVKGGQISPTDHVAYREKHGSYLAGKMFSLTPRQHQIVQQIADAIIALGGQSDLLATVCSWGDTLPEDEVLDQLTTWNARRAAVVGNGQGVARAVKGGSVESSSLNFLIQTMDAQVWAKEWLKVIKDHPSVPHDEGTMIAWFANAIMCGFDEAGRRVSRGNFDGFTLNKTTHHLRFADETEFSARVIIEPKNQYPATGFFPVT